MDTLTGSLPGVILSAVLASLYASLAHALAGRTWRDMPLFWAAAWLGFAAAALAAIWLGLDWGRVGATPVALGTIGSWAALLVATRLKV
jgi:hypothetical protein